MRVNDEWCAKAHPPYCHIGPRSRLGNDVLWCCKVMCIQIGLGIWNVTFWMLLTEEETELVIAPVYIVTFVDLRDL